jgi:hypothetical protein
VDAQVFFHGGGVVGAPSCGGYMVNVVMVCVAPKVQIVYILGVECLVIWVFSAPCRLCAVPLN